MRSYVLGIDIGTGSIKAVAADESGNIFSGLQRYYNTITERPGYSEQDPSTIMDAFISILKDAVQQIGKPPLAVSLSSAMHSVVPVDKNGSALSNLMLWSDSRSGAIAIEIKKLKEAEQIYRETGTPIHSMSPLAKITWLRKHESKLFERAHKFISIKEYIWYQLFQEFKVDHSLASGTGLFNIQRLKWNIASLKIAGITTEQLSEPVPTNYIKAGLNESIASQVNVSADTRFCIGGSDGCLANLGSHSINPGIAAITIGTSGAVRIARTKPLLDYSFMNFNYILDDKLFICGGPVNNGGNVLEWILKKFLPSSFSFELAGVFDMVEAVPPGSDGLVFLPYLHGERAPVWDDQACGVFFGIKSNHGNAHFIRAALEGVCFGLKNILYLLEEATEPISRVNVSGGFVQSSAWVQMLADITGKRLCLQQNEDASAIGAAYLGLKAIGMIGDYPFAETERKNEVHPRSEFANAYEKNFQVFKKLYPALRDVMELQWETSNGQ